MKPRDFATRNGGNSNFFFGFLKVLNEESNEEEVLFGDNATKEHNDDEAKDHRIKSSLKKQRERAELHREQEQM